MPEVWRMSRRQGIAHSARENVCFVLLGRVWPKHFADAFLQERSGKVFWICLNCFKYLNDFIYSMLDAVLKDNIKDQNRPMIQHDLISMILLVFQFLDFISLSQSWNLNFCHRSWSWWMVALSPLPWWTKPFRAVALWWFATCCQNSAISWVKSKVPKTGEPQNWSCLYWIYMRITKNLSSCE